MGIVRHYSYSHFLYMTASGVVVVVGKQSYFTLSRNTINSMVKEARLSDWFQFEQPDGNLRFLSCCRHTFQVFCITLALQYTDW